MLSTGSSQRQYDANGNLTESTGRHDVNILYNYLNLPREIVTCTDTIHYIYDATGNKWAEYYSGTQTFEKYYMGNFQYTNQNLDYIHNAYGRIRLKNDEYHYDYYLSDHLGNVRAVFTDNGAGNAELLQANSYYPFGMQFKQAPEYQVESNNYLYNGKELQQYGNLNTYDYGWRQYDAALGRWNVQDQLAEKYNSFSPYTYVMNSPINYIDPDGKYTISGKDAQALFAAMQASSFTIDFKYLMNYAQEHSSGGDGFELLYEYQGIPDAWVFKAGGYIYYPQGYYTKDKNGNIYNTITKHNIKQVAQSTGGEYSIDNAVNWLNNNAHRSWKDAEGKCGIYVRYGLEAGFGFKKDALKGKTVDQTGKAIGTAKTMGPYLEKMGFVAVNTTNYLKGDIAIIQGYPGGTSNALE